MEALGYVILFGLVLLLIVLPIYFPLKYSFIVSFFASSLVSFAVVVCIYWGADAFVDLRLSIMGYDLNAMSDSERLENVPLERREEANQLYQSRFGVGWPLSAILAMVFIVTPYILVASTLVTFYKKQRVSKSPNKQLKTDGNSLRSKPPLS